MNAMTPELFLSRSCKQTREAALDPGYNAELDRALYRDADDTITPDRDGSEWLVEPQYARRPLFESPLAADFPDADTSNWMSGARPAVTAWEGADMDAFWFNSAVEAWVHCQTGLAWSAPATLNDVTSMVCADILSGSLGSYGRVAR